MQSPVNERLVTVFSARSHSASVEAELIQSLLKSAGVPSWAVRENVIKQPGGSVIVQVLASHATDAKALLREAEAAGTALR